LIRNKFTGTKSVQKRGFCTKSPFLLQNLNTKMKRRNQKSENQLKTQQCVACITCKNEIKQNIPDLYHLISLNKLKVVNMLQKGGIIIFILVVAL
jgi:hypothetical protein